MPLPVIFSAFADALSLMTLLILIISILLFSLSFHDFHSPLASAIADMSRHYAIYFFGCRCFQPIYAVIFITTPRLMPPRHTPATSPYAELAFSGYAAEIIFAITPLRHAIIAIEADDTLAFH
jgi:hypothetical protein